MTLPTILRAMRKHLYLGVLGGLLGGLLALGASAMVTPVYQATTSLYFTLNFGGSANDLAQGSTYTSNQMQSFAELATSPVVLGPVLGRSSLSVTEAEFSRMVSVATPRETVIMDITVTDTQPQRAAALANAIGDEATDTIEQYAPQMSDGRSTVTVRTIAKATVPRFQSSPNKKRNAVAGGLIGTALGFGIGLLKDRLDNKVRDRSAVESVTTAPFLGILQQRSGDAEYRAVLLRDQSSPAAEGFRQLRANLQYALLSKQHARIIVTSPTAGEGKTTISINLATVFAESGKRVLLVDADLRRPSIAEYLGLSNDLGLTDALVGTVSPHDVVQAWPDTEVDVVVSGRTPPNAGEMLASKTMESFLNEIGSNYDIILIDSPPVLAVADAPTLAPLVDGFVVAVHGRRTVRTSLSRTIDSIRGGGGHIFGIVINGVTVTKRAGTDNYYPTYQAIPGE